jgi:eukaryotic-like serine/threonine-protein kinase
MGALPEQSRAQVLAHVEGCSACQRALAAAGADSEPSVGTGPLPTGAEAAPVRGSTISRYVCRSGSAMAPYSWF